VNPLQGEPDRIAGRSGFASSCSCTLLNLTDERYRLHGSGFEVRALLVGRF
jgi:hypothetical protein